MYCKHFILLGTLLGTLQAVDPQGGTVRYSTSTSHVTVDPSSGTVRLAQNLDAEVGKILKVEVLTIVALNKPT